MSASTLGRWTPATAFTWLPRRSRLIRCDGCQERIVNGETRVRVAFLVGIYCLRCARQELTEQNARLDALAARVPMTARLLS